MPRLKLPAAPDAESGAATEGRVEVGAALRMLHLIEAIARSSTPLSLEKLRDATGVSRATSYRLISDLTEAGVLLKEPDGKSFSAGRRLTSLGLSLMSSGDFRANRHSILQALASLTGETCNFTMFDNGTVLYVDRVESEWPLRITLLPGSRTPIHATSSGKLYLAFMPSAQRRRLLFGAPIPRFTDKTITDPDALEVSLRQVRKSRIGVDDEGYLAGLISVAVPVYGTNRRLLGTVSLHAPKSRLSLEQALHFVADMRKAASDLGAAYRAIGRGA